MRLFTKIDEYDEMYPGIFNKYRYVSFTRPCDKETQGIRGFHAPDPIRLFFYTVILKRIWRWTGKRF